MQPLTAINDAGDRMVKNSFSQDKSAGAKKRSKYQIQYRPVEPKRKRNHALWPPEVFVGCVFSDTGTAAGDTTPAKFQPGLSNSLIQRVSKLSWICISRGLHFGVTFAMRASWDPKGIRGGSAGDPGGIRGGFGGSAPFGS